MERFWKDDHDRWVRVTIDRRGGLQLHVLALIEEHECWVPLAPAVSVPPRHIPSVPIPALEELRQIVRVAGCPVISSSEPEPQADTGQISLFRA